MPWRDGPTPARVGRAVLVAGFTFGILALIAVLGQIPLGRPSGAAVVRLALRTVQNRVEVCRDRSRQELDAMPVHMRQPRVCDLHAPTFRLAVSVDGAEIHDEMVDPGGLRGDRPLIVDRQLVLPPGTADLEVTFEPVIDAGLAPEVVAAFSDLETYRLAEAVELEEDRITLILLNDETGRLELYGR